MLLQQTSASAKAKRQGADVPQSSQPKRKGAKGTRARTKRQKVATPPPPPPPASPIPMESSPSPPDVEIQQASSPPYPQEAPKADEPQQEEPQAEGTSTDAGEQTTGLAGSITSSAVPPIQTSIVLPQGNIFYNIATDELVLIQPHNSFCLPFSRCCSIGNPGRSTCGPNGIFQSKAGNSLETSKSPNLHQHYLPILRI